MQPDKRNHLRIFSCRGKLLLWSDLLDFELASFWPLVGSLGYYVQLFQSCPLVTWTKDVACTGGRCAGWDIIHRGQSLEATKALKIKVTAFVILFNRWWFCKTFQSLRIQADSLTSDHDPDQWPHGFYIQQLSKRLALTIYDIEIKT